MIAPSRKRAEDRVDADPLGGECRQQQRDEYPDGQPSRRLLTRILAEVAHRERPDDDEHQRDVGQRQHDRLHGAADFDWAMPTTNASRHHAVTSSVAAQLSARTPSSVLSIFRSVRIRARTGKAVIDIATPMNRAKLVNGTSAGASSG